jgi:hypothetical protein
MSPNRDNTIAKLVRDYRIKYPDYERPLLRKLIHLENKITNPSELKKLDRHLGKAFKIPKRPYVTFNGKEPEAPKGFLHRFTQDK